MDLKSQLKSVQFEKKGYAGNVEIKSGWDLPLNISKIEDTTKDRDSIYEATATNENKGFRLTVVYRFKCSPKENIKTIKNEIKKHIELDGSSIGSIILKYAGIPSMPIFIGGAASEDSESKSDGKKDTGRSKSPKTAS
ncbi:MAG: hypothetical protein KAJ91_02875 [Candidatus Aenigmarchaeota archaeon]|nr:hypothetical protein [Candidatus Aenigmarchaeota archaeon]